MARRALQTWQMKLDWLVSSRIIWSSQRPSSRRRFCISGAAQSCLMRTATPALTRVSGQTSQRDSSTPGSTAFSQFIIDCHESLLRDGFSLHIFWPAVTIFCKGMQYPEGNEESINLRFSIADDAIKLATGRAH